VLFGGYTYESYGAVILFQGSAAISLLSLILAMLPVFFGKERSSKRISSDDVVSTHQNDVFEEDIDNCTIEPVSKRINLRETVSAAITVARGNQDIVYSSLNNTYSEKDIE
jgi:hypothetical protein